MKTSWHTTSIKTRILCEDNDEVLLPFGKRFGHVRNVGRRKWYCENYSTKETHIARSLRTGKNWLIERLDNK